MLGDQDVFENAHFLEQTDVLKSPRHPQTGNRVRLHSGDLLAGEADTAAGRRIDAGDQIERGGLASAIGANQTDDLTRLNLHVELGDCGQTAKTLVDADRLQ